MSDSNVLDYLREQFARVNEKLDRLLADVADLKPRLTSVERQVGEPRVDIAGISARLDRVDGRLDRLERRAELTP